MGIILKGCEGTGYKYGECMLLRTVLSVIYIYMYIYTRFVQIVSGLEF